MTHAWRWLATGLCLLMPGAVGVEAQDIVGSGRIETEGVMHVGKTLQTGVFNLIGPELIFVPLSNAMNNSGDLYVYTDLEVGSKVYLNRRLYMEGDDHEFSDSDQWIYFYDNGDREKEFFGWQDAQHSFMLSDTLLFPDQMDVLGTSDASIAHVRTFGNDLRYAVDNDADSSSAAFHRWYSNGAVSSNRLMELEGDAGDLRIAGTLTQNASFDLAETFLAAERLEPGDLVRVDPTRPDAVARTTKAYDHGLVGVVSSEPAIVLGGGAFSVRQLRSAWGPEIASRFEAERSAIEAEVRRTHLRERAERLASLDSFVAARLRDLRVGPRSETSASGAGRTSEPEAAFPALRDREQLRQELDEARRVFASDVEGRAIQEFFDRHFVAVALAGRVPVKVDASHGAVEAGDPLAPSPVPGVAMKATGPGPIVGTALEPLAEGEGRVLTLVHRGWFGGASEVTAGGPVPVPENGAPATAEGQASPVIAGTVDHRGVLRVRGHALADYRPVSEAVQAGDVLVVDREIRGLLKPGEREADPAVVGVVAGDPGVLTGDRVEEIDDLVPDLASALRVARESGDRQAVQAAWKEMRRAFEAVHAPVATSGIVRANVDATYGAVRVGDLLTVSPTRGHAMRASQPAAGTVLGKALEALTDGKASIEILVMLR